MKKGLFHTLLTSVFAIAGMLVSHTALAQSAITTSFQQHEKTGSFIIPLKTIGGPYSSNRLKGSSRRKFTPRNKSTVWLQSKFPRTLGISSYDVVWNVKSLSSRKTQRVRGKTTSMKLSPGKYQVTMNIGKYSEKKIITVHKSRNVQAVSMPVKAGLLKVNMGSSSAPLGNASMRVMDSRGHVVATSRGSPIRKLLKSGKYTITYEYGAKKRGRNNIRIRDGRVHVSTIKVPKAGEVRIYAFEKRNQPIMKRTSWIVKDANGKLIKRTQRHTLRLSLFPGVYTAHVTVGGKKKSQSFNVKSGKSKEVAIQL